MSSHCDFVLLHSDPDREGVCAARSIHTPEAERATLSFSAQSIMQGAPERLNTMGGLTSAVWSKDLPTCSFDTEISGITYRRAMKIKMSHNLVQYVLCHCVGCWISRAKITTQTNHEVITEKKSYSRWLESCVYRNIWNVFGFHAAQNIPNNPICRNNTVHVSR